MSDDVALINGRIWTGVHARSGSLTVNDGRIASLQLGADTAPDAERTLDLHGAPWPSPIKRSPRTTGAPCKRAAAQTS